jgi:hypothetical protein
MKDDFRPSATQPNSPEDRGELDLERRIEELENSLSIALDTNDEYQRENVALKKRAQEAEGEMTIVKGIGMNSPEMREANKLIEELRQRVSELLAISKSHQNLMGTQIQENNELKRDNKALAKQIDDYFNARLNKTREGGW